MAAALLQDMARKEGVDIKVKSAGIFAQPGQGATQGAIQALKQEGIDIADTHRASPVSADLLEEADIILTMGTSHKEALMAKFKSVNGRVYTLKEYAYGVKGDIDDPFGGNLDIYNKTKEDIKEALREIINRRRYNEDWNR